MPAARHTHNTVAHQRMSGHSATMPHPLSTARSSWSNQQSAAAAVIVHATHTRPPQLHTRGCLGKRRHHVDEAAEVDGLETPQASESPSSQARRQ